ncbi:MAG: ribosome-associated translation inhibitor RaiA [Gammaproteobacteria bacterium]
MQIKLTGKKMEITPALREVINNKLQQGIGRFAKKIISIDVTLKVDKLSQIAEATLHLTGTKLHAESTSNDMYPAIDDLVDKLAKLLIKYKEKQTNHR